MSARVLSGVVALLAAGVTLVTLLTAGRSVAAERAVLAQLDAAQLTIIEVDDPGLSARIDPGWLDTVSRLAQVDWAVGLGPVTDAHPTGVPGAAPVAVRTLVGSSPDLNLPEGPGEGFGPVVYLGREAQGLTGLVHGAGALTTADGRELPVVGVFAADPSISGLNVQALVRDPARSEACTRVILQVENVASAAPTAAVIRSMLQGTDAKVSVAEELATLRASLQQQLGGAGRTSVVQTMAAGVVLIGLAIYAALHSRRRDFGRRRALGATRAQLVAVVLVQSAIPAVPGILLGAGLGMLLVSRMAAGSLGVAYPSAIAILTLLTVLAATLLPAVVAAFQDPVAALRVP